MSAGRPRPSRHRLAPRTIANPSTAPAVFMMASVTSEERPTWGIDWAASITTERASAARATATARDPGNTHPRTAPKGMNMAALPVRFISAMSTRSPPSRLIRRSRNGSRLMACTSPGRMSPGRSVRTSRTMTTAGTADHRTTGGAAQSQGRVRCRQAIADALNSASGASAISESPVDATSHVTIASTPTISVSVGHLPVPLDEEAVVVLGVLEGVCVVRQEPGRAASLGSAPHAIKQGEPSPGST